MSAFRMTESNYDFWLTQAFRYEREAAKHAGTRREYWLSKATDARTKASMYATLAR